MILGAAVTILLPSFSSVVLALDHHTGGWAPRGGGPGGGGAWNLPPVGKKKRYSRHDWLEQCEQSLAVVVASLLRGGGGGDDWNSYGGPGGGGGYYGEDDDDERYPRQPEAADDYYSRAPHAYDDYEDYSPAPKTSRSSSSSDIARILKHGDRKIGLLLLGAGLTITMLGFTLFFNKTLLRLGNVLLLAGVPVTLGPTRTLGYLAQREKWRASACLGFGMFLVLVAGHPFLGILAEVFGLLNIFGNLFPVLMVFLKQVPILGTVLKAGSNNNGSSGLKKKNSSRQQYQEEDDYYYDDYREDPYGSGGGDDDDRGGPYY